MSKSNDQNQTYILLMIIYYIIFFSIIFRNLLSDNKIFNLES